MASAGARVYNGGLGAEPPAGSRGRAPGRGSGGEAPLKLKTLLFFEAPRSHISGDQNVFLLQFQYKNICKLQAKTGKLICGGAALVVFVGGGLISMFGGLSPPKPPLALAPGANRHTAPCTSPESVISQCKSGV